MKTGDGKEDGGRNWIEEVKRKMGRKNQEKDGGLKEEGKKKKNRK